MGKVGRFFRDYTSGLKGDEFRRLFDRDAARTYAVLARDHADQREPTSGFRRFWYRTKVAFLGLSYKLTPARRMVFGGSLLCILLHIVSGQSLAASGGVNIGFPVFLLAGVGGLVYLLALELADRVLIRDELEVARQLQRDLLPAASPSLEGWSFAHSYRTANEVGGDYYDFPSLPDGRVAIVAGDASGHGMAAGLVMAIANATIKLGLDLDPSPDGVARLLNTALWRTGTRRNFMSLFYGVLDLATGRLDYICAGHPFPLLRRPDGGMTELGEGGFPLGLHEEVQVASDTARLDPGDLLVIYSDGLPEAASPAGEPFGYERVADQVRFGGTATEVHARLLGAVDRFRSGEPLVDDISLVIVERQP